MTVKEVIEQELARRILCVSLSGLVGLSFLPFAKAGGPLPPIGVEGEHISYNSELSDVYLKPNRSLGCHTFVNRWRNCSTPLSIPRFEPISNEQLDTSHIQDRRILGEEVAGKLERVFSVVSVRNPKFLLTSPEELEFVVQIFWKGYKPGLSWINNFNGTLIVHGILTLGPQQSLSGAVSEDSQGSGHSGGAAVPSGNVGENPPSTPLPDGQVLNMKIIGVAFSEIGDNGRWERGARVAHNLKAVGAFKTILQGLMAVVGDTLGFQEANDSFGKVLQVVLTTYFNQVLPSYPPFLQTLSDLEAHFMSLDRSQEQGKDEE